MRIRWEKDLVVLPACLPSSNGAEAAAQGTEAGVKVKQNRWGSASMVGPRQREQSGLADGDQGQQGVQLTM